MIPSNRWFPTPFSARAGWFENFFMKFSQVAESLGFSAEVTTSLEKDNQVMQFLAGVFVQSKAYDEAVRKYRKLITESAVGTPTPKFPENPAFALPIAVDTGIFQRLDELVAQIKTKPDYTDEIGALLQILPDKSAKKPEADVKPAANVFSAAMGHRFSVVVEGREKATTFDVYIKRDGQEKWELVKTASGKSVDVTVALTNEGFPERIQVMTQLMRNNQNYGQPSDPVYTTLNP